MPKTELPVSEDLDLEHAYDGGSKRRPRRALKPLERDILCRIIDDIISELRQEQHLNALMFCSGKGGIRMHAPEIPILVNIRNNINPRPEGE
jgi:hypothetical protein